MKGDVGVIFEVENVTEDVTQPSDVARQYRLTGERWMRVHLLPTAEIAQQDLFSRIEAYAVEQFAAHYDAINHITMPDVKGD